MAGTHIARGTVVLGAWIEPELRRNRALARLDPALRWTVAVALSLANDEPHPDKGILRGGRSRLAAEALVDEATAGKALEWLVDVSGWAIPTGEPDAFVLTPVRSRVRAARHADTSGALGATAASEFAPNTPAVATRPARHPAQGASNPPPLGRTAQAQPAVSTDTTATLGTEPESERAADDPRLQAAWDFMAGSPT